MFNAPIFQRIICSNSQISVLSENNYITAIVVDDNVDVLNCLL